MIGKLFRMLLASNIRLIDDVSQDIIAAANLGDRRFVGYGFSILRDAMDEGTELIHEFYEKASQHHGLGAEEKGRHWQEGSPVEILENMRLIQSHYVSIIMALEETSAEMDEEQARDFDRKRIQNLREMALRIQSGKMSIMEKDPTFWTPAMEADFKEALEYRLDR